MKKIISFSLWGNHPGYVAGALRNAELAAEIYPGWTCRFYLGRDVSHELVKNLGAFPHVETVAIAEPPGWRGMFWRFWPAAEADVEVLLVRDLDCRLGHREAGAVLEWLGSPPRVSYHAGPPSAPDRNSGGPVGGKTWRSARPPPMDPPL